jgi:4-amino-4-deoxy-L-arabinose transferase-like glycosyltransferase
VTERALESKEGDKTARGLDLLSISPAVLRNLPWRELAFWLALCLLLLFLAAWRMQGLGGLGEDYDEGVYVMSARLLTAGYGLYSDIYLVQPPLLIASIAWAFRLLEPSIAVARIVALFYSMTGVLAIGILGRELGGRLCGLIAAGLLSFAPFFFYFSKVALGDAQAASIALVALWCGWRYFRSGRDRWLFCGGAFLALSLLIKVLNLFALPVLGGLALLRWWDEGREKAGVGFPVSRLLKGLMWGGAGFFLPLVVAALFLDAPALFEQTVVLHWQARGAYAWDLGQNVGRIREFVGLYPDLFALAAFGGLMALTKAWRRTAAWLVGWFVLVLLNMLVHTPLWLHHLVVFLPPLALLAALAIAAVIESIRARRRDLMGWFTLLVGGGLMIFYLRRVPWMVELNNESLMSSITGRDQAAITFLQEVTAPNEFIISDDPMLVFAAGRLLPPEVTDVSLVTILSGHTSVDRLVDSTNRYDVQTVLLWRDRLAWLPDYVTNVEKGYLIRRDFDARQRLYYGRRLDSLAKIEHSLDATLSDVIHLLGYRLRQGPSGMLKLTLYWQASEPIPQDYTVFVHLVGPDGHLWAQQDNPPVRGLYPTHAWSPGEIISDRYDLWPGKNLQPGAYQLLVGMYRPDTLQRLPVQGADGWPADNSVALPPITY